MNLIKSKFNLIILISFFSHILASYFSTGWLNADEQSCVLEYVNFKLGYQSDLCFLNTDKDSVNSSSLIISSWFQPFIYFVIAKIHFDSLSSHLCFDLLRKSFEFSDFVIFTAWESLFFHFRLLLHHRHKMFLRQGAMRVEVW